MRTISWQRHLLGYAAPYKPALAVGGALAIAQAIVLVALPWPVALAIDSVLKGEDLPSWAAWLDSAPWAGSDEGRLVLLGAVSVLLVAINGGLVVGRQAWRQTLGMKLTRDLAHDTLERVQRRSPVAAKRFRPGDLVQRVATDTKCVETLVIGVGMTAFQSLVTFALLGAVMWLISPLVLLIAVAVAVPMAFVARLFRSLLHRNATLLADTQADVTAATEQMLSTLPEVQLFGAEGAELERFTGDANRQVLATLRDLRASLGFGVAIGSVTAIGTGLVIGTGGVLVLEGLTTIGALLVVLSYLTSLFAPVEGVARLAHTMATARAGALRVLAVTGGAESEVPEPTHPSRPPPRRRGSRIDFHDVSFGYAPGRPVLHHVSLTVGEGEFVAILGRTGAGKSSLVSLVPRFFDPWSGSIKIDGLDARRYRVRELRGRVALVRQDPILLPLSVRDNIAYGSPGASEGDVRRAAEQALAAEFIEALPDGYDSVLGEKGATLSGGQRQRLSIARAICRDAPILILDEPTAALDPESEIRLLDLITDASRGRTILMIAHRLSTVRYAQRIIVIEGGRIAEDGDHASLLALGGVYANYHEIHVGARDNALPSPTASSHPGG